MSRKTKKPQQPTGPMKAFNLKPGLTVMAPEGTSFQYLYEKYVNRPLTVLGMGRSSFVNPEG